LRYLPTAVSLLRLSAAGRSDLLPRPAPTAAGRDTLEEAISRASWNWWSATACRPLVVCHQVRRRAWTWTVRLSPTLARLRRFLKSTDSVSGSSTWTTDAGAFPCSRRSRGATVVLPGKQSVPGFGAISTLRRDPAGRARDEPECCPSPLLGSPPAKLCREESRGPVRRPLAPDVRTVANQPYLAPLGGTAPTAASYPRPGPRTCLRCARLPGLVDRAGMEMLVARVHTRPERPARRQGHCAGAAVILLLAAGPRPALRRSAVQLAGLPAERALA